MKRSSVPQLLTALLALVLCSCDKEDVSIVQSFSGAPTCETPLTIVVMEMLASYGDSLIVKYGDWEMLVDAGNREDKENVQKALKEYVNDGVLEMLLLTHMHADHIGAMTSISFFDSLDISVQTIVDNGNSASTSCVRNYASMRNSLIDRGADYFTPWDIFEEKTISQKFVIDQESDVFLEFFDPGRIPEPDSVLTSGEMNGSSIACVFNYPNTKLVLGGDLPSTQEAAWINSMKASKENYFSEEEQNIFKSCHHGSRTSNGDQILKYVKPDMIFSTSGMLSDYPNGTQHPYFEAVERESKYTDKIYWTSINGQIEFNTNGNGITMRGKGRSKDYYVNDKIISRDKEKYVTLLESAWYKDLSSYMK